MLVVNISEPAARERSLGMWSGRIQIASDFDELPDEVAAAFRGEAP